MFSLFSIATALCICYIVFNLHNLSAVLSGVRLVWTHSASQGLNLILSTLRGVRALFIAPFIGIQTLLSSFSDALSTFFSNIFSFSALTGIATGILQCFGF